MDHCGHPGNQDNIRYTEINITLIFPQYEKTFDALKNVTFPEICVKS